MGTPVEFYAENHLGLSFGQTNPAHPNGHSGKDVKGWAARTPIPSIARGRVVAKVPDNPQPGQHNFHDLGNYLVIRALDPAGHERPERIGYCHLDSFDGSPEIGTIVALGGFIGPVGNTGYSFGNHVHVMVSLSTDDLNSRRDLTDPYAYIVAARTAWAHGGASLLMTTAEPEKEDDMPQYVWTSESGTGYALIDSNYTDGCIITADREVAVQFSMAIWSRITQGAPEKMSRTDFNAKLAAVVALWRRYADSGPNSELTAEAIADLVIDKLGPTFADDADVGAMRDELITRRSGLPARTGDPLVDDFG